MQRFNSSSLATSGAVIHWLTQTYKCSDLQHSFEFKRSLTLPCKICKHVSWWMLLWLFGMFRAAQLVRAPYTRDNCALNFHGSLPHIRSSIPMHHDACIATKASDGIIHSISYLEAACSRAAAALPPCWPLSYCRARKVWQLLQCVAKTPARLSVCRLAMGACEQNIPI